MYDLMFTAPSGRDFHVRATAHSIRQLLKGELAGCPHYFMGNPIPKEKPDAKRKIRTGVNAGLFGDAGK